VVIVRIEVSTAQARIGANGEMRIEGTGESCQRAASLIQQSQRLGTLNLDARAPVCQRIRHVYCDIQMYKDICDLSMFDIHCARCKSISRRVRMH
jgi:hypothetical protein